jgi:hypothetical protein
MYYEDVKAKAGQTLSELIMAYGHAAGAWQWTWNDPKNEALVKRRGRPENIQAGDVIMIPIPWHVISHTLVGTATGAQFVVKRNGGFGTQMNWVQTLDQSNQPFPATSAEYSVDATPPDDDLPFYWTSQELQHHKEYKKMFKDGPSRPAPTAAMGKTRWRATVSIGVFTEKRVTVYDSWVWGFDRAPAGAPVQVGPRQATPHEVRFQLQVLSAGFGTDPKTFKQLGWTFRTPP